ncbi:hypothetical protein ASG72_15575 [Bosea sp. Leaf344]|uniref:MFS transporter n=1 Tax=Bosea sp. Leaf344 TaxID=1736346 RepID=UPI00070126FA|nr:MFS transporter [Bosea sp. Leaf344]KQU51197.1 hypothetical protein ASG72_15575 [Bosea sp. Leaf344]
MATTIPGPLSGPRQDLRLILALGVTQVAGYGALYYAFAVLAPEMTKSLGWAPEWTYGAFATGLLAGGLVAPFAGRMIDRFGTRVMMSLGSILAAASLYALSQARDPVSYFGAMIALEMVSTLVLYDAAFTALTEAHGKTARRAISKLTLIGGFASTLFWPLTTGLLTIVDWRMIYQLYALGYLVLCLPLHLLLLPRRRPVQAAEAGPVDKAAPAAAETYLTGPARTRAFLLLALAFSLQGFVVSAMSVHMLTMLQGFGLSAAVAVGIGAMVGPSQVAGRLVEMLFGMNLEPTTTAWVSATLMPVGFALLLLGSTTASLAGLFAIAYGISMGLGSIVRGTVPLRLFGPAGYGAMLGKLSAPGLLIRAAAPLAFAVMVERAGSLPSTLLLVALSAAAASALFALSRFHAATLAPAPRP